MQESGDTTRIREVPATLHGLLAARLDALDPAERSLLEDCAVVGANGPIARGAPARRSLRRAAGARPARRTRPHRARRRRRLPLQVRPDPRDRVRHAHQGRTGPAPRTRRARCSKRAARRRSTRSPTTSRPRPSSSPSSERVPGVPVDVREQAVAALERAADRAELVESWALFGQHHDRALGLLPPSPSPERWRALLGRGQGRGATAPHRRRPRRPAHRARRGEGRGRAPPAGRGAHAARRGGDRGRRVRQRRRDARRRARVLARGRRRRGRRRRAARARRVASLPRRSRAGRAVRVGGARRVPRRRAASAAARGRSRTSRGSRSPAATSRTPKSGCSSRRARSPSSATGAGSSWAYGLLAFVRYNQGRLEEAAALAEHIAIDGRETGNRWAVGMMNVLLANVRLWSGRMTESVARGQRSDRAVPGDRRPLGRGHGDRPGRARARRARARRRVRRHARALPRDLARHARRRHAHVPRGHGVARRPPAGPARGRAGGPASRSSSTTTDDSGQLGFADGNAAVGLGPAPARQGRRRDRRARARLRRASPKTAPVMSIGCRLALAYAAAHRPDDADLVIADLKRRSGGTLLRSHARALGRGFVRTQQGAPDAREPVDAAYDDRDRHRRAARARDRGAGARRRCSRALGTDDADDGRRRRRRAARRRSASPATDGRGSSTSRSPTSAVPSS